MKTAFLTLCAYAALTTYPAYTQVTAWTNNALNEWASERVGSIKTAQAADPDKQLEDLGRAYQQVANAMKSGGAQ